MPPAATPDKISGPMDVPQSLSSIWLGLGTLIGKAHVYPIPALDKNQSPIPLPKMTLEPKNVSTLLSF